VVHIAPCRTHDERELRVGLLRVCEAKVLKYFCCVIMRHPCHCESRVSQSSQSSLLMSELFLLQSSSASSSSSLGGALTYRYGK